MREYPHRPDPAIVQRMADDITSLLVPVEGMTPAWLEGRTPRIWASNAQTALDGARYAVALGQDAAAVRWYLRQSSACFSRGLAADAPFHAGDLADQVFTALVLGEVAHAARLCALPPARAAMPGVSFPAALRDGLAILGALAAGDRRDAQARAQAAAAALRAARLPRTAEEEYASAFVAEASVAALDAPALGRALQARAGAFARRYANPVLREDPKGLLDLHGLAIAALGRQVGLAIVADSAYLPLELLEG